MNLFEADGMLKIGNVELKFLVDFEKNGDMLLWKTAKYSGFVYTKAILGAHIYQNAVRIVTPGCTADINCDGDDTAQKVLNIITNIMDAAVNVRAMIAKMKIPKTSSSSWTDSLNT